ncbi:biotin/lipoyl-binding protein, partial [Hydrogenophaga sp.]|uniref:biotin/lipoyl-binding protein n=1 Tax=Hydrogenophaga sp. TaxID=1904254 RepID=UPI00272A63A9
MNNLFSRYGASFRHSWQQRATTDHTPRLQHEARFELAEVSLAETPASPAPRLTVWLLMGFFVLALLWAIFGRIDVVATAQGKIVPNDRIKTIQSFGIASVKAIHVSDGQRVKAGDVLIELDATTLQAETDRLVGEQSAAALQVARGQALLGALGAGHEPLLKRPADAEDARFLEAQRLLAGQYAEFAARLSRIVADTARRE